MNKSLEIGSFLSRGINIVFNERMVIDMKDFILGLKLAICYITYGWCHAKRSSLMDAKHFNRKRLAKINKLDMRLAKLTVTINEIESLG